MIIEYTPSPLVVAAFKNLIAGEFGRCFICDCADTYDYLIDNIIASEDAGVKFIIPLCADCMELVNDNFKLSQMIDAETDIFVCKKLEALLNFRQLLLKDVEGALHRKMQQLRKLN